MSNIDRVEHLSRCLLHDSVNDELQIFESARVHAPTRVERHRAMIARSYKRHSRRVGRLCPPSPRVARASTSTTRRRSSLNRKKGSRRASTPIDDNRRLSTTTSKIGGAQVFEPWSEAWRNRGASIVCCLRDLPPRVSHLLLAVAAANSQPASSSSTSHDASIGVVDRCRRCRDTLDCWPCQIHQSASCSSRFVIIADAHHDSHLQVCCPLISPTCTLISHLDKSA